MDALIFTVPTSVGVQSVVREAFYRNWVPKNFQKLGFKIFLKNNFHNAGSKCEGGRSKCEDNFLFGITNH